MWLPASDDSKCIRYGIQMNAYEDNVDTVTLVNGHVRCWRFVGKEDLLPGEQALYTPGTKESRPTLCGKHGKKLCLTRSLRI